MPKAVHLINDEKFLPRFMERAAAHFNSSAYIVFGAQPPYKFITQQSEVFTPKDWQESVDSSIQDVYIHFMTYQKIKWVKKHAPKARVHWVYFGSDLYELLTVFHGFKLYSKEDAKGGFLSNIKGKTPMQKLVRYASLWFYHGKFKRFVREHLSTFRFWNEGDFDLFQNAFNTEARFIFFQYGADLESDIQYVKSVETAAAQKDTLQILVNHSGTRSGNHLHILSKIKEEVQQAGHSVHSILSYGDAHHSQQVDHFGQQWFGKDWHPHKDFMPRLDYYELLSNMDLAIFGHVRQEAGNSLFISMLLGTKVFVNDKSVLLPYLSANGFHFFTLNDIGQTGWMDPLSAKQRAENKAAALAYFNPERIQKAYLKLAQEF